MTKKNENGDYAKMLYVMHGMSLTEIAAELGIAYRTLQNWKTSGEWQKERSKFVRTKENMSHSLSVELANIVNSIERKHAAGEEIDMELYKHIGTLVKSIEVSRKNEMNSPKPKQSKLNTSEALEKINKILKGEEF